MAGSGSGSVISGGCRRILMLLRSISVQAIGK
ncbi:MAG: hypothetical protein EAZ60_12710 [Oscillatoriales cyanobacterium]|nr:MAG: hypothetical protein EAZ83_26510 [Oscillatoriales cyanobacterium]TAF00981.1 MAG: hypothetical protein EAZ79_01155 [Oscillatoriales cyanobacterium]TAF20817.1 MAG: hypothetical protein EAZ73_11150 [Oscillatoriales cyanobacterium]TAF27513.1 MAG: hypothetical protein EAZ69_27945 [Oscillatoriales cyanobacterium]TAF55592.1 MAG: hypothetical protein EAZ60_12710 [Oscillatoriales cyanobacterium]